MLLMGLGRVFSATLTRRWKRCCVSCSLNWSDFLSIIRSTMKRPYKSKPPKPYQVISDIRKDISQAQLAGIGAVALAFNYTENTINRMLVVSLKIPGTLHAEVVSRINGIDG